ncbi:MAG TPA: CheR family methyltransferase [Chryseosolibacter sp.]|nr:CheR family methyltransferase [Chryseosolibacter sp.]
MTEMRASSLSRLSTEQFHHLTALVFTHSGINLPESKKVMLESRLNKRLRALKMESFKDYIELLSKGTDTTNELIHMIDVVTTNKTDFFREPHHFTYLENNILPELAQTKRDVRIWSAACSSGEEPYTLAMILENFASQQNGFHYDILASDISTTMLEKGALAIYMADKVECIPQETKKRYLLKSRDLEKPTVRIAPLLRSKVKFERINLMDAVLPVDGIFDIVFCRNVLIYFDRKTQLEVVKKLTAHLAVGGYLFIGHSESLHQAELPLTQEKPTVYKKILA